jgi:hypothetical protein
VSDQSEHEFRTEAVARLLDIDHATAAVLVDIADERRHQVKAYEYDRFHDDQHSLAEWGWLLASRAVAISCPFPEEMVAPDPARLLLEHAAVAAAALESWRRRPHAPAAEVDRPLPF